VLHDTAVLWGTLASVQATPQAPQWVRVLRASQPLRALPSQLAKPMLHMMEHTPPEHEGVPPVLEQALPQPPQWLVEVMMLTQPAPIAEQSVVGGMQVVTHVPPEQRVPGGHTLPQPPQWLLSVETLTHVPSHDTWPIGQVHVPITQSCPPVQRRPQAPQWLLSEARLVSQPLLALPSQLPKPELQVPKVHVPPTQEALALGKTQRLPQLPQWLMLLRWSTSQPLLTLPSQLPKPVLQVIDTHTPPAQVGIPLVSLQLRLQAPQCRTSVLRSTSQPSVSVPLQSPRGAMHAPPNPHAPTAQMDVRPIGDMQRRPHIPQWLVSLAMLVSQPSMGLMLQSAKPGAHDAIVHKLLEHAAPALAKRHWLPQAPQWEALFCRLTSQPSDGLRLQSP
jgi:hypothetical protein